MSEFLNPPFIIVSILIFVVLVNENSVIENIDTLFYAIMGYFFGMMIVMIKDYLLYLKNNPKKPPIYRTSE